MKNLRITPIAALCTTSLLSPSYVEAKKASQIDKPYVVFILIDDLSYFGVGAYGAESVSLKQATKEFKPINTPNLDRLAREGVICSNAYSHGLSEPTRIALMTGMNGGRNFLYPKALHESQITFGDVFKRQGYATGMFGKWKQTRGTAEIPGEKYISTFGWDEYACFDVVYEAQRYINPSFIENGNKVSYSNQTTVDPSTGRRWYGPDIFNCKAVEFIEKHKDEPFFLYYPLVLIHSEHRPTPDTKPTTLFDTMPEGHKEFNDISYFSDMISYADKMVGKIVDKLQELNLRENTLVVVMGDNGSQGLTFKMKDGSSHKGGKGRTNYAGEQVPLIFSRPGTISPSKGEINRYKGMVDVTDIYPTLIEASNLEIPNPEKIDGISLWKQLQGKENKTHREIIYKWYHGNRSQQEPLDLLARYSHNHRYKYYAPSKAFPKGRFFDLEQDPYEEGGVDGPIVSKSKAGYRWNGGLDIEILDKEKQSVMKMLADVNDKNAYTKVDKIEIISSPKSMKVGQKYALEHQVLPSNATRNGVIWESSDKLIATVNKFGEIEALKPGEVTINIYSWDDAWPVAIGKKGGYLKNGIKSSVKIQIN